METLAFDRPFVRVSPNFLDSVGQMAFRFLYDQFFQSAFFALWIALRGLLPKASLRALYIFRTMSIISSFGMDRSNFLSLLCCFWHNVLYNQIVRALASSRKYVLRLLSSI